MGTYGRQWDTMTFHGLTKPFQGAVFRDFSLLPMDRGRAPAGDTPLRATNSAVLWLGKGGFGAFSRPSPGGAGAHNHGRKKEKARRPVSRVLYLLQQVMAIHLGRPLPDASRDLPGQRRGNPPAGEPACRPYLVLLPVGFTLPPPLPEARCALTAPFHPCRGPKPGWRFAFCGTFPGVAPAGR